MSDNVTLPGTGTIVETLDTFPVSGLHTERQVVTLAPRDLSSGDSIGSLTEAAPSSDVASSGLNGRLQRIAQRLSSFLALFPLGAITRTNPLPVIPLNFNGTFKDGFDSYDTGGSVWSQSVGGNDIVRLDGNAVGASYLAISKDPLAENTVTNVTSVFTCSIPVEIDIGAHASQRTLGQEFSMEVVSSTSQPAYVDTAIASVSQTTTILTVNTVTAHNVTAGMAISLYGVSDSRFNYPALVVASTPTPTQFTCTAGPGGTIPSITAGPFSSGNVTKRQRLGNAVSGTSLIFENATATNGAVYVRPASGDSLPSGTAIGSHEITIGSTASVQAVNAAYNYAFTPTTQYSLSILPDKLQWTDAGVDSISQEANRQTRTQVLPDLAKTYALRFRATNNRGLTRPVAKIVSMSKSGSTTATVTTDVAHGLTTSDLVVIYGSSDQTNYANLLVATAVASVIDATHFTVVIGVSTTSTVYGGFVARVNGGNLGSALGYNAVVAVSATLATASDGTQALTLTGNTNWAGLLIGDYVNVHGLRSVPGVGSDIGCDGAWMVRNVSTTLLELGPIGSTVPPANFGATVCGGAIIKRTDLRISFVRMFDFDRTRVELLPRPVSDISSALPVVIQNGLTVNSVVSNQAAIPGIIADIASAAITTTTTTAAVTPTFGNEYEVNIIVTAVSGTTPTLDVVIQESDDSGTSWYDVFHFDRITATGQYRSQKLPFRGNRVRYVQTVTGTTPSFTRSLNRLQGSSSVSAFRQFFDRTVLPNTLNSLTPSFDVRDCRNLMLVVNTGAITTTAPIYQMEGSDDNGLTWYAIGSTLTAVASATVALTVSLVNSEIIRARVSTAGVGATAGYVKLKGF